MALRGSGRLTTPPASINRSTANTKDPAKNTNSKLMWTCYTERFPGYLPQQ
jgi:hypothetical protein